MTGDGIFSWGVVLLSGWYIWLAVICYLALGNKASNYCYIVNQLPVDLGVALNIGIKLFFLSVSCVGETVTVYA